MSNYGFVICNDDPYVGVSQCCFVMSAIVSCVDIEAHYAQSIQYVDTVWTWYQEPIITVPFLLHNEYLEICLFIPVFKWRVNPFKWRVSRFCSTFHQALYYTLSWQVSGCINFANIIFVNHPTLKLPQGVIVSFLMKQ